MVVFGDQVTKILHNSLFTFLLNKARQAKMAHMEMKISQPIFGILVVLTKNNLTKICNEPGRQNILGLFCTESQPVQGGRLCPPNNTGIIHELSICSTDIQDN